MSTKLWRARVANNDKALIGNINGGGLAVCISTRNVGVTLAATAASGARGGGGVQLKREA